ncbi:uncharacterized protein LOC126686077 isoform X2 [Mercurialis annua]|uniref:uncharacterized protein LOC126686077 isoform X2 n=1 Tax=Mercurialis annua TaxID=3986 RepID=UPI00215EFF1C|nr:uncharacterized protein LOC126686077 isoform X2 [Mercurialis annua]
MGSPKEIMNAALYDQDQEMDSLRSKLFRSAMRGEWGQVVEIYTTNPKAYAAQITKSGDTALHLAVRDGQEDTVAELVEVMSGHLKEAREALNVVNDNKNTALHVAAAVRNARMCYCLANLDPDLVGVCNEDMETPFFWAAVFGEKDVFLCLHSICGHELGRKYYRKADGDTILHVAIKGEYFDLAYQIIFLYEELVNSRNEEGITPLHLLANKPSAFQSCTYLGGYNKFIYPCIFVDELKVDQMIDQPWVDTILSNKNNKHAAYPENYETCLNILWLPKKFVKFVSTGKWQWWHRDLELEGDTESQQGKKSKKKGAIRRRSLPSNYYTCFDILKFASKAMLVILGLGSMEIKKLEKKKEKHTWSVQIMDELLQRAVMYEYECTGGGKSPQLVTSFEELPNPHTTETHGADSKTSINAKENKNESVILIAAKNGITEMVEKILDIYPVAIHDMNSEKKNIVLLAVENRQPHVYELLWKREVMRASIFRKVDDNWNSALHLAAMLGDSKPWRIPGAALQMQWEFKWYQYVKNSMPHQFFAPRNKNNETPKDIFSITHQELVRSGGEWLTHTSESCSVVAALIATVAFATSATVPGGVNQENGEPTLESHPAFNIFAISSLVALCFSVTAVVMFLSILTSRYQEKDFESDLPTKLLVGLSSLFVSIAAILVSFCAGHFFVLRDELKVAALPVYAVTCLPVTLFAIAQFPLYFDLLWATFKKVPQRSYIVLS